MALSSFRISSLKLRNCLTGKWKYATLSHHSNGSLWKGFCSHSNSKDSDKNAQQDATKKTEGELDSSETTSNKKQAISEQLLQQILSMKVTGGRDGDTDVGLKLAKPTWGERRQKRQELEKLAKLTKEESSNEHPDLDPKVVSAVKDVASDLGGNVERTESELLQKLRSHNAVTEEIKAGTSVGDLFSGMKIDRTRSKPGLKGQHRAEQMLDDIDSRRPSFLQSTDIRARRPLRAGLLAISKRSEVDLFAAPPLNIFTQKSTASEAAQLDFPVLETWDRLESKELLLAVTHPFANAYEEQIQWTKRGILWKFPINNEQGMDEEAKIGFHEHVFLENLIEDFPKKGPVRHFMELVLVGLSKNPYITVDQKKDHIDWFRNFFKDKEATLKEVGALN